MTSRGPRTYAALLLGLAVALSTTLSLVAPGTAHAAMSKKSYYFGSAGGTKVTALGTTVRSDLIGASTVEGYGRPASKKNSVAGVNVARGLVKVGAVRTWAKASYTKRGTKMVTGARTADVSLLGGAIRIDAVDTEVTTTRGPGGYTGAKVKTRILGLTIDGKPHTVPVDKKNVTIQVPGLAAIVVNGFQRTNFSGGLLAVGYGLGVTLLKPFKSVPAAATVALNLSYAGTSKAPPPNAPTLGGVGYGSRVIADAGPALEAEAGPTAILPMPPGGTGDQVIRNSTARVDLAGAPLLSHVLKAGAIETRVTGRTQPGYGRSNVVNEIAGVSLLNGLVKVDAAEVRARATKPKPGAKVSMTYAMKLVDLVIDGKRIPVLGVSPNTVINVAGVAKITLNKRTRHPQGFGGTITAVEVRLTTEQLGLPVGAVIQVGHAEAYTYGAIS